MLSGVCGQGGRMTQYLEKMDIGETIDVKGPLGHFIYKGRGSYSHHGQEGQVKQMSMVAGGTGITPMWQVVQVLALHPPFCCCCCCCETQAHPAVLLNCELYCVLLSTAVDMLCRDALPIYSL